MTSQNRPKRILIFSLVYYPRFIGGAEAAIKEITDRIDPAVIEFDMITLRLDSTLPRFERIGNVNVHRTGFAKPHITLEEMRRFPWYLVKVWYPIGAFMKAVSLCRRRRYDALWSMMTYMAFPAALFKIFYRPRTPLVITLQDGDPIAHITGRWRIRLVRPLLGFAFRRAAVVQTISNYLADFARTMGARHAVEVVPNGVNVGLFARDISHEERSKLRHELGFDHDDVVLVTTSRLVEKNGLRDVIAALPHLPPRVKFLVIGIGPDEQKLKELARTSDVAERVVFFGFVPNHDLPRYLKSSDIFIRPSLSEGMGSSFVEAMAAALPVIATPVGGIVDFLFDPERNPGRTSTGLFANVKDPGSIARQAQRLIDDPAVRDSLASNGQKLAREQYDWTLVARAMQDRVLSRVIG